VVDLPTWTSEVDEFGLRYNIGIQIADGQFVVPVIIELGKVDVHTLRNVVENDIRLVTDLIGYLHGCSFDVDMISAVSDDGPSVIFGTSIPVLEAARKVKAAAIDGVLLTAVGADLPARLVLANFREAMRNPVDTGFFCYRAVEAMMQSMKESKDDKDAPAWIALGVQLQVHRSATDIIKAHADDPRHGKISVINSAERAKVFQLSDEIIKRYLEYLRHGKAPLSDPEFPLLTP
jgi:hypothetical protein